MIDFQSAKIFESKTFEERYENYIKYTIGNASADGLWLEFGVATGESTQKYLSFMRENQKPLYGFDSFEGLPSKWAKHKKGAFSTNGVVPLLPGAEIIVGLFEDTLPNFFQRNNQKISVLIIDCDLYKSTKTIFENCKDFIQVGTIIIFDEIHNGSGIYKDWKSHEYRAFMEFVSERKVQYKWLAFEKNGEQASCVITNI
jgi:predicted O-methyltransferase YrrM